MKKIAISLIILFVFAATADDDDPSTCLMLLKKFLLQKLKLSLRTPWFCVFSALIDAG
jgi:hypothetical protein